MATQTIQEAGDGAVSALNYLGHPCSIAMLAQKCIGVVQLEELRAQDPRLLAQNLAEQISDQIDRAGRTHDVLTHMEKVAARLDTDAEELSAMLAVLTEYSRLTANEACDVAGRVLVALERCAAMTEGSNHG